MLCTRLIQKLYQCRSLSTSFIVHSSKNTNSEFIRNVLGCEKNDWDREANSFLEKYERENLHESVNTLKKLGFSDTDISSEPRILAFRSQTLISRHRILCDYCFHRSLITATLLRRFVHHFSLDIHELKRKRYINKYKNVLGHVNKKLNVHIDHLQETMPLKRIHLEYLIHYLMSTLCMSYEDSKYHLKTYSNLRARSFRCISENVKLLTSKFGFDLEKIKKHVYVLHADRSNMLAMLKAFPKDGPLDIKQTAYTYPNILMASLRNIQEVIECLQRYGYGMSHISCVPMILVLKPATLEARLSHLHTESWFQPYAGLPRALMLAFSLPTVEKRRKILDGLNMKCVSINTLACSGTEFNTYAKHGRDKLTSVDGFKYLGSRLNVPHKQIFDKLKSHPYLRYVSLQQIHNSLNFLLEKFNEDLIYQNLQLVLYPVNVITEAFSKLQEPTVMDTTPCQDNEGQIQHQFLLPLALYVIERDSNFSGYGVWDENQEGGKSGEGDISLLPVRKRKRKPLEERSRRSVKV